MYLSNAMSKLLNTYNVQISHPDKFRQLAVGDMLFLQYRCPQVDKHIKLFTHYNEIVYTLNGIKTISHGERSFYLTDNKSLFIRRTAYSQELHEVVGWEVLAFYFQDDFLREVFREYRQYLPLKDLPPAGPDMLLEIYVNDTTRTFFYSIVPYFTQAIPPSEGLLQLKFKELLFNVLSDPLNAAVLSYIASIENQRITPIWEVMEANYMFNLPIAEFARLAQRSEATFKRDFLAWYQTTPGKWLTQKRLEYAKLLLRTSNWNVNEIACESGFENLSHFSRIFKEKYGTSPLQYRKREKKLSV
jgi:AraC family transcriptional regulator, exoenzyme S synthesis regulatory protein ExsA